MKKNDLLKSQRIIIGNGWEENTHAAGKEIRKPV
jgi:hypothetical protein